MVKRVTKAIEAEIEAEATSEKLLRVVFHINEVEKWPIALGNIRNLLKAKAAVSVKVVVNGAGITGYLDAQTVAQMAEIQSKIVGFEACRNALKGHEISEEQVPEWVRVVPAGIIRLIELQPSYAYIKP